ncbi:hypothetical protein PRK78_007520 [Emydomyces testavorans]|uniref:CFEM domain-containing protein n=1 Tax=Emydomyces testavorans TaxID=2070801 RepID=A0AAF0ILH5_9EURO|nr:hypothetical protein PRK78_007520 [Emydomyces testavorans]
MKTTALLSIALCALLGAAQNMNDISACGRMCIQNMLNKAPQLGCGNNDMACLCSKIDFGYGVRDCTQQACGGVDLEKIVALGQSMCASNGGNTSGTGLPTASSAQTGVTSSGTNTAPATATGNASSAISTIPVVSTVTSGSKPVETTIGSTTLYTRVSGSGTATGSHSGTTITSAFTSTVTSGSSTHVVTGTTTQTQAGGATTTTTSTSTSRAAAGRVMATGAPGVAGALGLMAMLAL